MKIKKKYEQINCSNEHIFRIDFDGVIKQWKCVVLDKEVVPYEDGVEQKHLKIKNAERAPGVMQIDTVTTIYGEQIPFQLENGIPFIQLEDEWVPSDTFAAAKQEAAVKMYQRQSKNESIVGLGMLALVLGKWLFTGDMGQWWILSVFGIFFLASAALRLVRLRNELNAMKEAEEQAAAEREEPQEDAIAAARALRTGKEEDVS